MRGCVSRLQLQRAAVLALCVVELVLVLVHDRERSVRLRERVVDLQRAPRRRRRARARFGARHEPVVAEQAVGIGEPGVREREIGSAIDRFLEVLNAALQAVLGAGVPVVAPLQIQVERVEVLRRARRLPRGELRVNRVPDRLDDLIVERQHVGRRRLERAIPQLRIGTGVNQPRVHPDPARVRACARWSAGDHAHGAFEHRVHVQSARDLRHRLAGSLELHRGRARDDVDPAALAERADQLVGDAVGEIFLRGIARQVRKRQHRDRPHGAGRHAARRGGVA